MAILKEWCERNNMKINTSKTAFQVFSLADKTIHPRLRYKALSQSNEFRYLGVTFDNKLNWKNHPVTILPIGSGYFPLQILQLFSNLVILHIYLPKKMEQSVPKLRHKKF